MRKIFKIEDIMCRHNVGNRFKCGSSIVQVVVNKHGHLVLLLLESSGKEFNQDVTNIFNLEYIVKSEFEEVEDEI